MGGYKLENEESEGAAAEVTHETQISKGFHVKTPYECTFKVY